jgi:hypothetical protein
MKVEDWGRKLEGRVLRLANIISIKESVAYEQHQRRYLDWRYTWLAYIKKGSRKKRIEPPKALTTVL